jgi:hypothetical protein
VLGWAFVVGLLEPAAAAKPANTIRNVNYRRK